MTNPGVSVIIPAYNSARYLTDAIDSVRAQQWSDLEIIVVDDGSTDETSQILSKLAGNDLRVIKQANAGVSAARNTGIKAAQGEWIAFLDADDRWLPGKLKKQFEVIRQLPHAGFSFTDVRFQYPDGKSSDLCYNIADGALLPELLVGNILTTPTIMVRRDCMQKTGAFDTQMQTGEDWDVWLRLALQCQSAHVPSITVVVNRESVEPSIVKYPLAMLEFCTLRVIQRFFNSFKTEHEERGAHELRRVVYAWQYAVLAKSYLRHGMRRDFVRLVLQSVRSHPVALSYLSSRGEAASDLARSHIHAAYQKCFTS